jgi:hypothetical protein
MCGWQKIQTMKGAAELRPVIRPSAMFDERAGL